MSWFTGAADGLERALVEQEVLKRQAMLDALKKQEMDRQFDLDNRREARMASDSKRQFDSMELDREGRRIAATVDDDTPGDIISDATAALREKHGYGGSVQKSPVQAVMNGVTGLPSALGGDVDPTGEAVSVSGGQNVARGGAKYLQAQMLADERAKEAAKDAAAKKERADADRRSEENISKDRNLTTRAIAGQRIAAAGDKPGSIQYAYDETGKLVAFRTRGDQVERVELPAGAARRTAPGKTPEQLQAEAFSRSFGTWDGKAAAKEQAGGDKFSLFGSVGSWLNGAPAAAPRPANTVPGGSAPADDAAKRAADLIAKYRKGQ